MDDLCHSVFGSVFCGISIRGSSIVDVQSILRLVLFYEVKSDKLFSVYGYYMITVVKQISMIGMECLIRILHFDPMGLRMVYKMRNRML